MFTIFNEKTPLPIKVWLNKGDIIEPSCLAQAEALTQLPFLHKWVALMPDTHTGMGMPIGGVIATRDTIIPNAVGKDIGCGMAFVGTNISAEILIQQPSLLTNIIGDILQTIPVGFSKHKLKQPCTLLDSVMQQPEYYQRQPELIKEAANAYYQIGTLGGGNHFIELQSDQDGYLGIMIHSGSRHLGHQICDYFQKQAKLLHDGHLINESLAHLPVNHQLGQDYIHWMNLALDYAYDNRLQMMNQVKNILSRHITLPIQFDPLINCHHNYASLEHHYDAQVWVHRKGATRANYNEIAIIPGAMGSYSYLVRGLGNPESFCSSSHGAGRSYSRKGALAAFSKDDVLADLKQQGVILGKTKLSDVAEESRFAYKDIDQVMANQQDLVNPIKQLKTIGVIKG